MFDLSVDTHCWIIEELSEGRHFKYMIYSRFLKYVSVLKNNKRSFLRTLVNLAASDVRSLTGSNLRKILVDTGKDPGSSSKNELKYWRVHQPQDSWTTPLLVSMLEVRSGNWEVNFDGEEDAVLHDEDVEFMISALCTG